MSKMSSSQASAAAAYPPLSTAPTGPYVAAPPAGYPTRDFSQDPQTAPIKTKSKGDGFLKGCLGALCCCCMLDACF